MLMVHRMKMWLLFNSPAVHRRQLLLLPGRGRRAATGSCGVGRSGIRERSVKTGTAPPAGRSLSESSYRFLGEVGLLQHHGPGLTEAVSGALGTLDAQLHRPLRHRTLRKHNHRRLRWTLEVHPDDHTHTRVFQRHVKFRR